MRPSKILSFDSIFNLANIYIQLLRYNLCNLGLRTPAPSIPLMYTLTGKFNALPVSPFYSKQSVTETGLQLGCTGTDVMNTVVTVNVTKYIIPESVYSNQSTVILLNGIRSQSMIFFCLYSVQAVQLVSLPVCFYWFLRMQSWYISSVGRRWLFLQLVLSASP